MKLKENTNTAILEDCLGQIINVFTVLEMGPSINLMCIKAAELKKMIDENPDQKGQPMYFSFHIGPKEAEFYFYPKANKDYEIKALYYPAAKMG